GSFVTPSIRRATASPTRKWAFTELALPAKWRRSGKKASTVSTRRKSGRPKSQNAIRAALKLMLPMAARSRKCKSKRRQVRCWSFNHSQRRSESMEIERAPLEKILVNSLDLRTELDERVLAITTESVRLHDIKVALMGYRVPEGIMLID